MIINLLAIAKHFFNLQANINSIGSLARQIQRGSKSQEILGQTVKNFATVETTVSSTENNIAKLQVSFSIIHIIQIKIKIKQNCRC